MTGYLPQYELAALLILGHLRRRTLEFIRVGDPTAGRLDDVVIGIEGELHAYSVKWSDLRGNVSFGEITNSKATKPALIKQLADGWVALRDATPDRRVIVHLATCNIPSSHDSCPGAAGIQKSFAAFYEQAWRPFQENGEIGPDWQSTWDALQTASGLNASAFADFARHCRLDFNLTLPTGLLPTSREENHHIGQLRSLASSLANLVRDPTRQVEYSRDELLKRLGWGDVGSFRHRHEFPTPDPYEPILASVDELRSKLEKLSGGYIAVIGSPGSGKSTLLTRTLEDSARDWQLVKYYAYVPGSTDPATSRGEAIDFLHDVVVSLDRLGTTPIGESEGVFDLSLLRERLHKHLQLCGAEYSTTKRATVILIDGLDHIPREQHPERSLLRELPYPEQIPAGVFLVLGTQTDSLAELLPAVRQSIGEAGRRIEIQSLSREAVGRLIRSSSLPVQLSAEQHEEVARLANGHPLALRLLLNRLKAARTAEEVDSVLEDAVAFVGDLDKYYSTHWQSIETDAALTELLLLLARMRRVIDLGWIASWTPASTLRELRSRLGHFFREVRPGYWQFFHNSFRQYLLAKTTQADGAAAGVNEQKAHRELAARCENSGPPHTWETVFHLSSAGDFERVLELATPAYFRQQLSQLRPVVDVLRDARYAVKAAGHRRDVAALVERTLFLAELVGRVDVLDSWKVGQALLDAGNVSLASEYLLDGPEVRVGEVTGMRAARQLLDLGHEVLARRLFEASEPLGVLRPMSDEEREPGQDTTDVLREWADTAPLFRPVSEVVALIRGFVPPKSRHALSEDADDAQTWRCQVLCRAALSMRRRDESERANELANALLELEGDDHDYTCTLDVGMWIEKEEEGERGEADALLEELMRPENIERLTDAEKIIVGRGAAARLGKREFAKQLLADVAPPSVAPSVLSGSRKFTPCVRFFEYYRLMALLGQRLSVLTIVPDPKSPAGWAEAHLSRVLIQLAQLSADARLGCFCSGMELRQRLDHALGLFQPSWRETRDWLGWHAVESLRKDIHELVISVVHEHGADAVETLRDQIDGKWQADVYARAWPPTAKRDVVLGLWSAGCSRDWAKAQLQAIAHEMLVGHDVSGRIDECAAQARAWNVLGEPEAAIKELERLVAVGYGVGYRKDYQLEHWLDWLAIAISADRALVPERLAIFAAAIVATNETTEGVATRDAALKLIAVAMSVSPLRAVALMRWFEQQGCVGHAAALEVVLREAAERALCRPAVLESVFAELLCAISTKSRASAAAAILRALARDMHGKRAIEACARMVKGVEVRALGPVRPDVLRALAMVAAELGWSFPECHLTEDMLKTSAAAESGDVLVLKDGTRLELIQVQERATSVAAFLDLWKQRDESYFRWGPVLDALLPRARQDELETLVRDLPSGLEQALSLAKISRRLTSLGARARAKEVATKALHLSWPYGWARWSDGGTRFEALSALVEADPATGRATAWNYVTNDLVSGHGAVTAVAQRMNEILPMLAADASLAALYPVVEDHVVALGAPKELLESARAALAAVGDRDTCEDAISEQLTQELAGPVPLASRAAMRALCAILRLDSAAARSALRGLLAGTARQQVAAIELLETLAAVDIALVTPFADEIRERRASANYWVGITCNELCRRLGDVETYRRPQRALPGIYALALPPTRSEPQRAVADEVLPEARDAWELVRPFDETLANIAKLAELDEENVIAAAAAKMKELATAGELLPATESELRVRLENAGLKFSFRRLRPAVAREAMLRVAAEIADAGRLDAGGCARLHWMIRLTDPELGTREPVRRPMSIGPITGLGEYGSETKAWVRSTVALADHVRAYEGRVVLAEETELKKLDRNAAREVRRSAIRERDANPMDERALFGIVFRVPLSSYADIRGSDTVRVPVILRNAWVGCDTNGCGWIALNPVIAKQLGWKPAADGMCRWVDRSGKVAVETIWWEDASVEVAALEPDAEVGEGHLVLASPSATRAICELCGATTRFLFLERSYRDERQDIEGPVVRTSEPIVIE